MIGAQRRSHPEALARYVRVAVEALGPERIARPPITGLPPREPHERVPFWPAPTETARRHVLYAIRLARLAAERYDLPLDGCGDFRFVDLGGTTAGRVVTRGYSYFIELDRKYRGDSLGTASILAHEFAHVFLAQRGVHLASARENEELTDTVAALAGFGRIMEQVSERVRFVCLGVGWAERTHYLGYLSREDLRWLRTLQERIAGGRPLRVWAAVDPAWRPWQPCPGCASRLRLPRRTARILLTCPVCGLVQGLKLALGARTQARSLPARLVELALAQLDARSGARG